MAFIRLLTGAAALTVVATLAQAADMPVKARPALPVLEQASGYVEVYGGWGRTSFNDFPFFFDEENRLNGWTLGGAGRGNYWLAPNMSMQLDAQAEGISYRFRDGPGFGTNFNGSHHSYLIAGHFNWRDSQRGLLGAFAGAGDYGGFFDQAKRHVVVGGEGQIYWNQFTLYVQGGYNTTVGTYETEWSQWFIRGTGRYFFTANTMLEGTVQYASGDADFTQFFGPIPSISFNTWLWEAKLEHRFAATPFSLYVKYRGSETTFDDIFFFGPNFREFKTTDHRVLAGLRLYMGENTLLSNDRHGATLDIKETLPAFIPFPAIALAVN
jgi:hypothetical protein